MTNADKIRSMTNEELALFIKGTIDTAYRYLGLIEVRESGGYWLDWLKQDVDDPIKSYCDADLLINNKCIIRFSKRR